MPEVRELWDYWEESPPAHEMLQLIATSQFIGWERPKSRKRGKWKPPGPRKPRTGGKKEVAEPEEIEGAPVSRGKYDHSIIVDSKEKMYVAAQTMSMLMGGKVSITRKK
jgi:hypothetical protein